MEKKIEYYPDGNIKAEGSMFNDKKEGIWTFYYANGMKYRQIFFHANIENGLWIMWHENGNLYIEQNKKNGKSIGVWKEFYENGEIKEIGEYLDDQYKPLDFWDEFGNQLLKNGNGKKIEKFGAGLIDVFEHYYQEGKLIKEIRI